MRRCIQTRRGRMRTHVTEEQRRWSACRGGPPAQPFERPVQARRGVVVSWPCNVLPPPSYVRRNSKGTVVGTVGGELRLA